MKITFLTVLLALIATGSHAYKQDRTTGGEILMHNGRTYITIFGHEAKSLKHVIGTFEKAIGSADSSGKSDMNEVLRKLSQTQSLGRIEISILSGETLKMAIGDQQVDALLGALRAAQEKNPAINILYLQ